MGNNIEQSMLITHGLQCVDGVNTSFQLQNYIFFKKNVNNLGKLNKNPIFAENQGR